MDIQDAMQMTKNFEGYSPQLYKCTAGYLTIGYGRNVEQRGISREEAEFMFQNDYKDALRNLQSLLVYEGIKVEDVHKDVFYALTDMMFNMGYDRLSKFKKLFSELKKGSYEGVAREMKDSAWYKQVGNRSKKLVEIVQKVLDKSKKRDIIFL